MRVLVDADACPVKKEIVSICQANNISVLMFLDHAHAYEDGYSQVILVDQGADSVDFALINEVQAKDIVVTQDYGVAMMALAKHAYPINQNGMEYNDENMDTLLYQRYVTKKAIKARERVPHAKKRTQKQNEAFASRFEAMVQRYMSSE